jgi:hypothetical protein
MYVRDRTDCAQVFAEAYRVLCPGGRFLIWDAVIPTRPDTDKEIVAFPLTVCLPGREIKTGYGTKWPGEEKNLAYYIKIAAAVGFEVVRQKARGAIFSIELKNLNRIYPPISTRRAPIYCSSFCTVVSAMTARS